MLHSTQKEDSKTSLTHRTISAAATWITALLLLSLCACAPERAAYSDYCELPKHVWQAASPVSLTPHYGDSTATYSVLLVVRNTTDYQYKELNVAVDLISSSGHVTRRNVHFAISDDYGNFTGSGFGTLYQRCLTVAHGVKPTQVQRVVVWPAMRHVQSLKGVANVGIIVSPDR